MTLDDQEPGIQEISLPAKVANRTESMWAKGWAQTMTLRFIVAVFMVTSPAMRLCAISLVGTHGAIRVEIDNSGPAAGETILLRVGDSWIPALSAASSPVRVEASGATTACTLTAASEIERGFLLTGSCGVGKFEQRIVLGLEDDVLDVSTRLTVPTDIAVHSVEDRYEFMPEKHSTDNEKDGPLDFVWSQNIKSEADDLIPTGAFKSPAVMLQQGEVFAALMPRLSDRRVEPLALDLDVTSAKRPWIACGAIPSQPHGHSYFRRAADGTPKILAGTIQYSYSIVVSRQPLKLGYQRVVRRLWATFGHPALLNSADAQRNAIRTELSSFDSWRTDAWTTYANMVYVPFDCGGKHCGTLMSNRNPANGRYTNHEPDAWFNGWFETLRTAYGWYLHGRQTHDLEMMAKAENVLNLILSAPQKDGAFPTIYMVNGNQWLADDGWAGYGEDYHAFCMSWTAYWMLRWAEDLTPQRSTEILRFAKSYGDFLLRQQLASGVIPSWYDASLQPRKEFRDFNAETAVSALFLVTLGTVTADHRYIASAERAMDFVTKEVIPRQRWFDFETFLSCAKKDYGFYDRWTAQYPQNNLAAIQASQAWLALFQATHNSKYLDQGTKALDYLLLTQEVWNNPSFSPKLVGGFTTQNTDAEWSDARQGYAAPLLLDYYRETGRFEYLERSIAAARATFAVAPWENWGHTGYIDKPGALTGFHWGTGSAMTSIEIMSPILGDAFIDLNAHAGVGFDECSLTAVQVRPDRIAFQIESPAKERSFVVRFAGVNPSHQYRISWNGKPEQEIAGRELITHGYRVGPLS
jgi:hypothetical protein